MKIKMTKSRKVNLEKKKNKKKKERKIKMCKFHVMFPYKI